MIQKQNQLAEVTAQLNSPAQKQQFDDALPKHIPTEKFIRVVRTALNNNPELLDCDRRSLGNACMRAAQDGLLPDGNHGALVVYKSEGGTKKMVQWLPMIAGIRELVRNSKEIEDWYARVVYERDVWEYEEGDHPKIVHKPTPGDRGKVIAAYSIAKFKTGGLSREWMWLEDLLKVRATSKAKRGPWQDWTEEMYRKTVAKRHAKVLPMSSDLDDLLRRPDEPGGNETSGDVMPLVAVGSGQAPPPAALTDAMDQITERALASRPKARAMQPIEEDDEAGEVIDAGEYADSDDVELPLDEQAPRQTADRQP